MTNWKQFKKWLDQNIIEAENDNLLVKVKVDKQSEYGELSTTTLTNFCDSLEATLDNNSSYHLFPAFSDSKCFQELFDYQNCYFGKKTNQEKMNKTDYDLLKKLFDEWKLTHNDEDTNKDDNNTLGEKLKRLKVKILEEDDNGERDINLVAELKAVVRINIELQRNRSGFFESMFNSMFQGNDYICQKSENLTKFIDMATINDSPPNPAWATTKSTHYNMFFDQQVKNRQVVVSLEALMVKLDEVIAEDKKNKEKSGEYAAEALSLIEMAIETEKSQEKLRKNCQLLEKKVNELETQLDQSKKENEELREQLFQLKAQSLKEDSGFQLIISAKEDELAKIKSWVIEEHKLDKGNREELDNLLELQIESVNNNLPILDKQLEKTKKRMSEIIAREEVDLLCKIQRELIELQRQEQKFDTKIEISPK